MEFQHSPFLNLPPELRLEIYLFALLDSPHITVGTARVVGKHSDVVHRLYCDGREPDADIPLYHEPVVEPCYDSTLLLPPLTGAQRTIEATTDPSTNSRSRRPYDSSSRTALLATSKLIRAEVQHQLDLARSKASEDLNDTAPTALYVAYPYGLQLLRSLVPNLLHQTHTLHLAGIYNPTDFNPQHAAVVPATETTTTDPLSSPEPTTASTRPNPYTRSTYSPEPSHKQELRRPFGENILKYFLTLLFDTSPPRYPHLRHLTLRVFFPGPDSYATVWGDDHSPVCIALRSVGAGDVDIEVWRGRRGTGVVVRVRRDDEGGTRRVGTVWRDLGERGAEWVVDERWP